MQPPSTHSPAGADAEPAATEQRVGVIGAGPSGITAAKNLLAAGFRRVVVYDRNAEVGGNWIYSPHSSHSSVFETTHIISSKGLSQYEDFPMPDAYPDYPGHAELKAYFQSYARHFGVDRVLQLGTEIRSARSRLGGGWTVTLGDGRREEFDALLVASGHHWDPRMPSYPGTFSGELLHSHAYKTAERFAGQRVLVIGGGNSASDIAVETARCSARTEISMRRGYWFVPKFLMGLPTDVINERLMRKFPKGIRQQVGKLTIWLVQGKNSHYGLPEPEHGPLEAHPTINSELLYFIRHGRIHPRPDIARFEGRTVHFVDGSSGEFDVIIAATGYVTRFPFLDTAEVGDYSGREVPLYLKVFHPCFEDLFFIGLFQPQGCIWPLSDWQGRLVARALLGAWKRPANIEAAIRRELSHPDFRFTDSVRHAVEVDYHEYRKRLMTEVEGGRAF
jgi:hypothetical protein